jgi:predicted phosphoadenosine phosphosulfate sulfurtransferase
MEKIYQSQNVYEAFQSRMDYIFGEFDNIYVSFSGGKDSGLLWHLVQQYMQQRGIHRKIGIFHQDFEAQYTKTTEFVERTFASAGDDADRFWCCLPMAVRNAMSTFDPWWYPWDPDKQDIWVRPMPEHPYVLSVDNNPFDFYKPKMLQDDLYKQFGRWYGRHCGGGRTVGLIGIRATESLSRYSSIVNKRHDYDGRQWITHQFRDIYSAAPLYDWTVEDVWTANGKFGFAYNALYDLYYKAGVPLSDMRVASPFIEWAGSSLNLYRVIEPETWSKVVGRVNGANFGAIYGSTKALGFRDVTLPAGHTWKSYTEFLLSTLPPDIRENYLDKFKTSAEFWAKTGGGLTSDAIAEIEQCGYRIRKNGVSNYSKDGKSRIVFEQEIPDNTDDVKSTIDIPSWKRMCFCILKNDYLCRFMGFGPTKPQQEKINLIKKKYAAIARGNIDV